MKPTKNTFSQLISIVSHPLLITTYMTLCIVYYAPSLLYPFLQAMLPWVSLVFMMTFLLPVVVLLFLRFTGFITNVTMEKREQRIVPLLFISVIYIIFTYGLYARFASTYLFSFMTITSTMIVFSTVTTFFYKISLHSLSAWGGVGFLMALHIFFDSKQLFLPVITATLLAGLISSARLALNAHLPQEVTMGGLLGFFTGFFGVIMLI